MVCDWALASTDELGSCTRTAGVSIRRARRSCSAASRGLEGFLDREVDALGVLLAEAEVQAQVGLRSLVDQQAQPGAAGGREAVEEALVTVQIGRGGGVEKGDHAQQPILRQRGPILDLAVDEPLTAELAFSVAA